MPNPITSQSPLASIVVQSTGDGWWWSTLTSGPAMTLLLIGIACLAGVLYLGWRLRRISATRQVVPVRERFSDDSGVAMIEFVLVTPILLSLMLMLIQTMLVFTGLFYVQYAAFAGARSAIVHIPMDSSEPINEIVPERGSTKFDAIESAAMIAVMPISGREASNGGSLASGEIVNGLQEMYATLGRSEPPWIEQLLGQRLVYATNHTSVTLETVTPGDSLESVVYQEISGQTVISPKEAISVRVRHEFALTIPLASKIFSSISDSGTYTPASSGDGPSAPGEWTAIESRAILTNEGIDRRLPEPPPVPRRE